MAIKLVQRNTTSENAKAVAQEVIENVGKGRKIVLRKIIQKHGYSESVSNTPSKVVNTQSYQEMITPIIEQYELLRNRAIDAIGKRNFDTEKLDSLIGLIKVLNHSIEAITGRPTPREEYVLPQEEMDRLDKLLRMNS